MNVARLTQQRDHQATAGGSAVEVEARAPTATSAHGMTTSPSPTTGGRPWRAIPSLRREGRATRIAIVEHHLLFAQALEIALTLEGYEVHRQDISDRAMPGKLLTSLVRARPEIALLDLDLVGVGQGLWLIEPLTRAHISVVVLTESVDGARWGECLRYGACTVLSKSAPLGSILATFRCIDERRAVLPGDERERLLAEFEREQALASGMRRKLDLLTPRERDRARPSDVGASGSRDRACVLRIRGDGPHPGEVDPGETGGHVPARGGRGRASGRVAAP